MEVECHSSSRQQGCAILQQTNCTAWHVKLVAYEHEVRTPLATLPLGHAFIVNIKLWYKSHTRRFHITWVLC
jgi:hypothetical protein